MTESIFERVTNEILEASENIATRFEEGLSVLMTGSIVDKLNEGAPKSPPTGNEAIPDMDGEEFMMDDDMGNPLPGIADSVLGDILKDQVGPQTPMEHFHAFRSAITWDEPFILSLLAFHVVMFLLCYWASRKNRGIAARCTVMVLVGALVRGAQYINDFAASRWESFATQNYFDKNGVFIGIMFCGPLFLNCFMMLILSLREASQLLVEVKTMEIKRKRELAKKQKEKKESENKKDK